MLQTHHRVLNASDKECNTSHKVINPSDTHRVLNASDTECLMLQTQQCLMLQTQSA